MGRFWESETPTTITTSKNVVQYYREAEKLSVARPPWTDGEGATKQGKTVMLDIGAVLESNADAMTVARDVFAGIVQRIDERLALRG